MYLRASITLASAVLGTVLAFRTAEWMHGDRPVDTIDYFEADADAVRSFADELPESRVTLPGIDGTEPPLRRFALSSYFASKIFPVRGMNRYDPVTYFAYAPNLNKWVNFREHPKGRWRVRTNSLGMRRDEDVASEAPALRVLVAGDSHVDGVCNNREAFPALVEAELERRFPERDVELLNAARGGYSPYNYLGVLEKYLYLKPDVFLVVITGANDFSGLLQVAHMFEGTELVRLTDEGNKRSRAAADVSRAAFSSGCNALHYYKHAPVQAEFSLETLRGILLEMQRICAHEDIRPLVCYLPMQATLDWSDEPGSLREVRELLELAPEDLTLAEELHGRLFAMCEDLGLPALDLDPVLSADQHFYRYDLHLNTHGHAAVAELLIDHLADAPELRR
jgi:hypothetical protein